MGFVILYMLLTSSRFASCIFFSYARAYVEAFFRLLVILLIVASLFSTNLTPSKFPASNTSLLILILDLCTIIVVLTLTRVAKLLLIIKIRVYKVQDPYSRPNIITVTYIQYYALSICMERLALN